MLDLLRQGQRAHCWSEWPSGVVGRRLRALQPYPSLLRPLSRRLWADAAWLVAVSEDLRALAQRTSPGARIHILPNGVDTTRFLPAAEGVPPGFLFVGRLIERKGVRWLVEAFAGIARAHPQAILTIVGDGPERSRLEALVRAHGLARQVRFLGRVDRDGLIAIYRRAAVFVLPSHAEGLSNAALEAMASGLAIVTTPTGVASLVAGNGFVVPARDPAVLRAALERYLTRRACSPSTSALMRSRGPRT